MPEIVAKWYKRLEPQEDWVYDQSAETYALDPEMAKKLKENNPEAFKNIVGRLIEASNRGMWEAKPDMLSKLQVISGLISVCDSKQRLIWNFDKAAHIDKAFDEAAYNGISVVKCTQ